MSVLWQIFFSIQSPKSMEQTEQLLLSHQSDDCLKGTAVLANSGKALLLEKDSRSEKTL